MTAETRRRIQTVMAVALAAVTLRTAFIFYQRYTEKVAEKQPTAELPMNPDYYVVPRKLHAWDLKSARELVGKTVWVRQGYRSAYFPCEASSCDFRKQAGLLAPIERLTVTHVIRAASPLAAQPQLMVLFEQEGQKKGEAAAEQRKMTFGFSVGAADKGSSSIYIDDLLYLDDPHQLYRHWPADVWQAVDRREVRKGMNELQVSFALGVGDLHGSGLGSTRVLTYPNNGKPLTVTFENDKVVGIQPGP